ncbi:Uu.00g075130.m01.CDS01 [Anthostomella pinea]|uniref:Uu.00g075130.m01.CDS01 n=1 Tax=Anthostomella pinea TaxID=933095 RepID=A0AAI8VVN2_9PEZI|nr:Uu.00g075130.m01.CDS01 [Anthostomella pinea]
MVRCADCGKPINTIYNGKRSSSWTYLEGKDNVAVMAGTHAAKVIVEGNKAVGVEVVGPEGQRLSLRAKCEVILSLGVYESPKLLMLSGIGPKETLKKHGIKTLVDSPHVGQNLLDHPIMPYALRLKDGVGLDNHLLRAGPEKAAALAAYEWKNKGHLTSGLLEVIGLPRIDARLEKYSECVAAKEANGGKDPFGPAGQPHFEVDFVPMFCDAFQWHFPTPPQGDYMSIIVDLLRPQSKNGVVTLRSTDPLDQPDISLNFFSDKLDLMAMREGVREIYDILCNGEAMKDLVQGEFPWAMPLTSDDAMDRQILERSQTGFHPCGTTRMSKDVNGGVVDGKLKVHGIDNLRVIDASVIPVIPDCRIQNAVYMVAEKGADMIKAAYP